MPAALSAEALARPLCVHCKRRRRRWAGNDSRKTGSRGLCYQCYYTPDIRKRYPTDPKHGKRAVEKPAAGTPLPDESTRAVPGSEEKLVVMMERRKRKRQLHHPRDTVLFWRLPHWLAAALA